MIRPPPRSPLFPYPTLSRSPPHTTHPNDQTAPCDAASRGPGIEMKPWAILASTLLVGLALGVGGTILLPPAIEPYLASALDRKSTRLNSSHLVISYAVFCLK